MLLISMAGCAVISSIYGIFQRCGVDYFTWSSSGPRVFSTFGNPVFFAAQLVMVLPVAVSLFFIGFTARKDAVTKKLSGMAGSAHAGHFLSPAPGTLDFFHRVCISPRFNDSRKSSFVPSGVKPKNANEKRLVSSRKIEVKV